MKKIAAALTALSFLFLAACGRTTPVTAECWAYDTYCTATVWGGERIPDVFVQGAKRGETLLNADGKKQYYASAPGETVTLSDELVRILHMALKLTEYTDGKFDLTVAPLADLWDVSHRTEPPEAEAVAEALSRVGSDKIQQNGNQLTFSAAGVGLDVGSVGKGYGADETVRQLKEAGATAGIVSFGGNVATFGTKEGKPFRIGIRDPRDENGGYLGILTVSDCSVVTSGAYERYFEWDGVTYHHLIDATTGYPCRSDLLSVTVVCEDGAEADLLATALWLAGEEKGKQILEQIAEEPEFAPAQAVFVCDDGRIVVSDELKDLFVQTADGYRTEG